MINNQKTICLAVELNVINASDAGSYRILASFVAPAIFSLAEAYNSFQNSHFFDAQ